MCQKLHLCTYETLWHNKRFVTCKPPGYQAMHLNSLSGIKIIFKINLLDRIFPTWVMEGSSSQKTLLTKFHCPHGITIFK